jgi:Holliday junction resolvase RusA-like endonuclease
MDALNHIYWQNDSLISEIKARKLYDDKPRTEIYIQSL